MNIEFGNEFGEPFGGLIVPLHVEQIRTLCPQLKEQVLTELLEKHSELIAMEMVAAGINLVMQLMDGKGELHEQ